MVEVMYKQILYLALIELKESVLGNLNESLSLGGDGVLKYQGRLCVPDVDKLKARILKEAHGSHYSIHRDRQKCTMT